MPNYLIREIDATQPSSYTGENNVVVIPGFKGEGGTAKIGEFTLVSSVAEFTTLFGSKPALLGTDKVEDKSWIMAWELLNLGMQVIYCAVVEVAQGASTASITAIQTELKRETFWAPLADRSLYDFRFLTAGAYADESTEAKASEIATQMLNVANVVIADGVQTGRGDIVVLVDLPSGKGDATEIQKAYGTIGKLKGAEYGAGFTPWCNINTICPHNADAKNVVLLPPSYAYLAAYAQATQFAPSWNAVAGSARGIIPNLASPEFKFGDADANILMSRLGTKVSVNPICQVRPFGFIIWGNRTLKPNKGIAENAEGLTATSFLNVRNLICSIKKTLYAASRKFTFEQNTNTLWINFKAAVTPLLDRLVTGNGISSYSLRREATTDKAKLKAIISIRAIEAVEDFDLTVYVTDTVETIE